MMVLILPMLPASLYAQATKAVQPSQLPPVGLPLGSPGGGFEFEFSGIYTWGEVITSLCSSGWCRVQIPKDFYSMEVPLSIYENSFDDAFKALSMQALAEGYILKKVGKDRPFKVIVELDKEKSSSFISCLDTTVHVVLSKDLSKYKLVDSLKCLALQKIRDSLEFEKNSIDTISSRFRVAFYVVSSSYVQSLGVDWTDVWAKGDLFNIPDLITDWTFKAMHDNDSSAEYRSLEIDLDSSASIHWGSQKKEEKSTVVYSNGVAQSDFEWRDFGLTLDINRTRKHGVSVVYKLAQRDENNSVLRGRFGGGGLDSVVTYGVYDSFQKSVVGVPFLSSVPILGLLFQHEITDKIKSFFVISVHKINRE